MKKLSKNMFFLIEKHKILIKLKKITQSVFNSLTTAFVCSTETYDSPCMLVLLNEVIDSSPSNQSGIFDSTFCLKDFIDWNEYWKECAMKYFQKLQIEIMYTACEIFVYSIKRKVFWIQRSLVICKIKSFSEAVWKTVGSLMNN